VGWSTHLYRRKLFKGKELLFNKHSDSFDQIDLIFNKGYKALLKLNFLSIYKTQLLDQDVRI
jgi:hypothetical protein